MSRSKNRKIADLISGTTFDDGVVAASEVTGLATVATSGSFSDLSNQPTPFDPSTLGTASTQATGAFATAAQGTTADAALPKAGGAVTGNVTFGDNDKVVMGAGSDLQIYHDGSNSFISDQGTGDLAFRGSALIGFQNSAGTENYANFNDNGAVNLYHNNALKMSTFSGGVSVTGSVNADGLSLGDGDIANFGNSNDLQIYHSGSASHIKETGTGNLKLEGTNIELNNGAGNKTYILATDGGAVSLRHNDATKMTTTTSGIDVTGTVNADALTGIGSIDATTATAIGAAGVGGGLKLLQSYTTTSNVSYWDIDFPSGYAAIKILMGNIRVTDTGSSGDFHARYFNSSGLVTANNSYNVYTYSSSNPPTARNNALNLGAGALPSTSPSGGNVLIDVFNPRESSSNTLMDYLFYTYGTFAPGYSATVMGAHAHLLRTAPEANTGIRFYMNNTAVAKSGMTIKVWGTVDA